MSSKSLTPIIVGVGEVRNKSLELQDAIEPAELMLTAINSALRDTAASDVTSLAHAVDSIGVVPPWSWPYRDLPGLIAKRLGARLDAHLHMGAHGGNQPGLLCDEAARAIALGRSKVAVITGGEALASLAACQKARQIPPPGWTKPDPASSTVDVADVADLSMLGDNVAGRHSMGLTIHVYPMYENGFRAHTKQTYEQNSRESADMYAAFDSVACRHEYSWRAGETPKSARDIETVTAKNRMICTPYPLLMNAFNTVNLGAACIMTSTEHARTLGIPEEKWVYVLGSAGTSDGSHFWERPNYYSSPAIKRSIDEALLVSGLSKEEVDCFDFYSCFPVVPKIACRYLSIDYVHPEKPITLLGGLTSFGGAGNNYSMHALTEMTRQIRDKNFVNGLVLANGGVLSYQHVVCLSGRARKDGKGYPAHPPLPEQLENEVPQLAEHAEGSATIETYTVEFSRQGTPRLGMIVGRLDETNQRFLANHGDEATLAKLADTTLEPIGMHGTVKKGEADRNVFYFTTDAKL